MLNEISQAHTETRFHFYGINSWRQKTEWGPPCSWGRGQGEKVLEKDSGNGCTISHSMPLKCTFKNGWKIQIKIVKTVNFVTYISTQKSDFFFFQRPPCEMGLIPNHPAHAGRGAGGGRDKPFRVSLPERTRDIAAPTVPPPRALRTRSRCEAQLHIRCSHSPQNDVSVHEDGLQIWRRRRPRDSNAAAQFLLPSDVAAE